MFRNSWIPSSPTTFICTVCVEDLAPVDEEDFVISTPCSHVFHRKCLMKRMRRSEVRLPGNVTGGPCPYCKSIITMDDCRKIHMESMEPHFSIKNHYEEDLRVREKLAKVQADLKKAKKEYRNLKLRFNYLRVNLGPDTGTVTNDTNADNINPMPPNLATPPANEVNRSRAEAETMRTMPKLFPAPTMLRRGTSRVLPPRTHAAVTMTNGTNVEVIISELPNLASPSTHDHDMNRSHTETMRAMPTLFPATKMLQRDASSLPPPRLRAYI